jgi:hypothetical protein
MTSRIGGWSFFFVSLDSPVLAAPIAADWGAAVRAYQNATPAD